MTTKAPTTSTAATTSTTSGADAAPAVDLVAFSDRLYGVEGVAPAGWSEVEYGVVLRGDSATDATLLVQQAAPAATPAEVISALVAQLELAGPPPAGETIETDHLTWTQYSFETAAAQFGGELMRGEAALAASEFGAFVVGLIATPEEIDALLEPSQPIPEVTSQVATILPAELLRRRPDIRRAEMQAAAQSAQIGVARTELFPSFSLFGFIGLIGVAG